MALSPGPPAGPYQTPLSPRCHLCRLTINIGARIIIPRTTVAYSPNGLLLVSIPSHWRPYSMSEYFYLSICCPTTPLVGNLTTYVVLQHLLLLPLFSPCGYHGTSSFHSVPVTQVSLLLGCSYVCVQASQSPVRSHCFFSLVAAVIPSSSAEVLLVHQQSPYCYFLGYLQAS